MAEINNQPSQKKHQRTHCAKKSTKVDLTPMVDLGFILITFFVFTAALSEAKAMNIMVPNDNDSTVNDQICETCALTFILAGNNKLFYYEGSEKNAVYKTSDYSAQGIRQLILNKKKQVAGKLKEDRLEVIIKPSSNSNFKNLVDVIDECNINLVKRYYIDVVTDKENLAIQN
jgi:biopolymer transport protein ExbD